MAGLIYLPNYFSWAIMQDFKPRNLHKRQAASPELLKIGVNNYYFHKKCDVRLKLLTNFVGILTQQRQYSNGHYDVSNRIHVNNNNSDNDLAAAIIKLDKLR